MGMRNRSSPYYPIFLNIYKRRCVVVGGGEVALRKVKMLLEQGATVQVIAPSLCSGLSYLAQSGAINVLRRNYEPGDLRDTYIVIAATTEADTNKKVALEAKSRGTLVNVVDDSEQSDFIVPAYVRRGDLTIAVSTAGKSPALAQKIRKKLEGDWGEEYASLVALIGEVRSQLKQQGITVSSSAWQKALDLDCLAEMVRSGQGEKARATLLSNLKIVNEDELMR